MQEIIKKGKKIILFNSINELTMKRYSALNKLIIQEVGFGSTFEDVKTKLNNISFHLENKDLDSSKIELANLYFSIYSNLEKLDITSRAFLCFVNSIGGQELTDPEDELQVKKFLKLIYDLDLTVDDVESTMAALKKKLM